MYWVITQRSHLFHLISAAAAAECQSAATFGRDNTFRLRKERCSYRAVYTHSVRQVSRCLWSDKHQYICHVVLIVIVLELMHS
jgi:hypothetical protein